MAFPLVWTILVAILGLVWYFQRKSNSKKKLNGLKEIPGPGGYPIVGNVLEIGRFPNKQFTKWTKEYGDIYKVKLGTFDQIVISDPKMTKEIFSNDSALTGKYQLPHFELYEDTPNLGIFFAEGERWAVHRRFLLRQLRDFGFGKSSMESLIMDELNEVIETFKKTAGKPVREIREKLKLAVVNSLWTIMTSNRFKHDDPLLQKVADNTSRSLNEVVAKGTLLLFMPWLKHIIPKASGYTYIREVFEETKLIFEKVVEEKRRNWKEGEMNDFIDVYLTEMKKFENDPSSTFYGEIGRRQLVSILFNLFFAGNDSTAMTITWGIMFLCKFPEVQKKLQKEVDEVTGKNRQVSLNDKPNMPYAVAVIDEILRHSTIVPDGVQHKATEDTEFRGYYIPKGSIVQPNLMYIHFNPTIWGDPENFRPERYLSEDGKTYNKNENLMPFQIGKRQCIGETLARDSIFLYVTNLFQQFNMKFDPSIKKEPGRDDAEPGFLVAPLPFDVIMSNRV